MAGSYDEPRAAALRQAFHRAFSGGELPVPVEAIAEDFLGLAIEERELEVSGMLLPAERRILVNAEELPQRRRFTIAHELGHWVCQVQEGRGAEVMCRAADLEEGADRSLEREANIFAANLLMPEPLVREQWAREPAIEALAASFAVSSEAMHWRLYNCALVEEKPA